MLDVKAFIQTNLDGLASAAAALQAAAPEPDEDGWSAAAGKDAVDAMKAEWKKARWAYEHIEGAIAVLFRDLDVSTDARYDAFIETAADADPFDGEGVTGVHAIERILWSDAIPPAVVEVRVGPRDQAAPPRSRDRAGRGVQARPLRPPGGGHEEDAIRLSRAGARRAVGVPGVIGSLGEQVEKVAKVAAYGRGGVSLCAVHPRRHALQTWRPGS